MMSQKVKAATLTQNINCNRTIRKYMKIKSIIALMLGATTFAACSSDNDDIINSNPSNEQAKGMTLSAEVNENTTRASFTDGSDGNWVFSFVEGDVVKSINNEANTLYTFTKDSENFKSEDAKKTTGAATWHAYFPSEEVSLTGQTGTREAVANNYVLVGTTTAEAGATSLKFTMNSKVSILVIKNDRPDALNLYVRKGANDATSLEYVTSLTANGDDFTVNTTTTKSAAQFCSIAAGATAYVAVPSGVQLTLVDDEDVIIKMTTSGLAAGKYYNITASNYVTFGEKLTVKWARTNVGATTLTGAGTLYTNSEKKNAGTIPSKNDYQNLFTEAGITANPHYLYTTGTTLSATLNKGVYVGEYNGTKVLVFVDAYHQKLILPYAGGDAKSDFRYWIAPENNNNDHFFEHVHDTNKGIKDLKFGFEKDIQAPVRAIK